MTNILKFHFNEQEVDSDYNVFDERNYNFETSFSLYQKGDIAIGTGTAYTSINFNGMTDVNTLRLNTDNPINIKVNSGAEIFNVDKDLIWNGTFTALSINNPSTTLTANIYYELYQ